MANTSYGLQDVRAALQQSGAMNWDDTIEWLRSSGGEHSEIQGDVSAMVEDFEAARDEGKPFMRDPEAVLAAVHEEGGQIEAERGSTPGEGGSSREGSGSADVSEGEAQEWPGSKNDRPEFTPDDAAHYER